ncbi:MAG: cytochrome c3 family protein [Desulfobulbaceae bacterium]|nr:cytochrome c3 family protein [Desulfobulbaceae bacterium]
MNNLSLVLMLLLFVLFSGVGVWARTDEMMQRCDSCHTMHNSQDGNINQSGIGLQSALLGDTCYGCHTGVNVIEPGHLHIPYVMSTVASSPVYGSTGTEPGHNTLAAGSFYWVAQGNNLKGHNVNIPGVLAPTLTCAGATGCHGDLSVANETASIYQSHHAASPSSYRILNGIEGLGDQDYELTVGNDDHNQYKGISRQTDSDASDASISHLCATCHGNFHSVTGNYGVSDPWIRHPVDYDMGQIGGTYLGYGDPDGTYNVATPLGSDIVTTIKTQVFTEASDAIVVCISCHRAHGSPYDYNLRWNYQDWPASGYNGCGDCHAAKD